MLAKAGPLRHLGRNCWFASGSGSLRSSRPSDEELALRPGAIFGSRSRSASGDARDDVPLHQPGVLQRRPPIPAFPAFSALWAVVLALAMVGEGLDDAAVTDAPVLALLDHPVKLLAHQLKLPQAVVDTLEVVTGDPVGLLA